MEPVDGPPALTQVLTEDEQRIVKIARVGSSHEVDNLVEIIYRLAGELATQQSGANWNEDQ